jgi:hypothetical protein
VINIKVWHYWSLNWACQQHFLGNYLTPTMDNVPSNTVVVKMTSHPIIRFCYRLAFKHILEIWILISQIKCFRCSFGVCIGQRCLCIECRWVYHNQTPIKNRSLLILKRLPIDYYLRIIHICIAIVIRVIIPAENGCAASQILIHQVVLSSYLSLSSLVKLPHELLRVNYLRQWWTYSTKNRRSELRRTRKLVHGSSIIQILTLYSHCIIMIYKLYILE